MAPPMTSENALISDEAKVQTELSECDGCKGLPCQKTRNKHRQPAIENETWCGSNVSYSWCKPYSAYLRQAAIERKLGSAKIPPKYFNKTLADYTFDSDNVLAAHYMQNLLKTKKGAYFYGERGTGKTFLASIIAQEYIKAGSSVIFIKVPQLLDELYSVYRKESDTNEKELLKTLYSVDLLILDDFGMEKATKFAGTTLCKIIDARYDADAMTIITSNYPLERIQFELDNATDGKSYNGSRIVDRLREICKPILFKGNSRRR